MQFICNAVYLKTMLWFWYLCDFFFFHSQYLLLVSGKCYTPRASVIPLERKSVSLHCTPGVDSSNSLAKATVGEPEKDKIVLSLGRVNIPIFAGYSVHFDHFGLHFNQFPFVKL